MEKSLENLENIVSSYEEQIEKIQTIFKSSEKITESSNYLFDSIHDLLKTLKEERNNLNSNISEILAKNCSLRKKDYDKMMFNVFYKLEEREKNIEAHFHMFVESQKETARILKEILLSSKDDNDFTQLKEKLSQISKSQEIKKQNVTKAFVDFQKLHNNIIKYFEKLIKNGKNILIQDMKNIRNQITKELI